MERPRANMLADLDLRLELTSPTRLSWCPVRLNTKMLKLFLEVTQSTRHWAGSAGRLNMKVVG